MGMIEEVSAALAGRRVLVTGHTGFKGSWLSLWLTRLGAQVHGFALNPPTTPSMFDLCGLAGEMEHRVGDIRDFSTMKAYVASVKPEVLFHLAAQPIVRRSYVDPLETVSTNVLGTAHVLEAVRALALPCAVVVVSSDKCYENNEWVWGYRENDPMGGKDPYSMSKGATELVTASWRRSYFGAGSGVKLASARAGNVVGGGDWADDRIVPDCIRAFIEGRRVELRNPRATRPWQHVLEPLGGYLLLASRLLGPEADKYCSAWNFGPAAQDVRCVEEMVSRVAALWGDGGQWTVQPSPNMSEASLLALNCDKAVAQLGWQPTWSFEDLVGHTVDWYRAWHDGTADLKQQTLAQIARFESDLRARAARTVR